MDKKEISLVELKKLYTESLGRIVLYGAGRRGKIIARNLERFGFEIVFIDQNLLVIAVNDYKFISIADLTSNDSIIITPDNPKVQKEIENLLIKNRIFNFYYLDCNWRWYDAVVSCYGEKEYGNIDTLEQEWCALKQKYDEINVYLMWSDRIGELIYRFETMQMALSLDEEHYNLIIPYTVAGGAIANRRLMSIFGRYLDIVQEKDSAFWRYVFLWHPSELNGEKADYYDQYAEKEHVLYKEPYIARISLDKQEIEEAKIKFQQLNIKNEFVCIHARDSYYLNHQYNLAKGAFAYHDYRDFSVYKYDKLIDYLTEKDISVVRVGNGGNEKYKNPKVIDFAIDFYDELLDLYLNSRCKYYISTDTGAMLIPRMFAKNTIMINSVAMVAAYFVEFRSGKEVFIPKLYYSKQKGRYLSIKEMLEFDWEKMKMPHTEWEKSEFIQDVIYVENTEEDILETYIEADKRYCGKWEDDKQGIDLQQSYLKILKEFSQKHPVFPLYNIRKIDECLIPYTISSTFLKKHQFLVEGI